MGSLSNRVDHERVRTDAKRLGSIDYALLELSREVK